MLTDSARSLPPLRRVVLVLALAFGVGAMPAPAQAMSFGIARLNSALGQPLDLRIPVQSADPNDLDGQCLRLLPAPDSDIPTLSIGRVSLERDGLLSSIRVQSLDPIYEPALRVVLEAGCQRRMQREYVLLVDPPALRAPTPAASAAPAAAAGLELGEADIRAVRGRPLLIRVPLRGPEAPRLAADCVRTVGDASSPPALETARARLVDGGSAAPVLEISTREALSDRTVRVIAELGCERPIRREFDLLVETPPPQVEPDVVPATAAAAAPVARPARRATPPATPARPRPPVAPVPPAPVPAVPPPVATAPAPAPAPATPAPAVALPATTKDRLVLSAPDETPAANPAVPAPAATPSDEFVRKLDELASEVKRLRVELDAANQRNAMLTEKLARGDSINLGWAAAAVVSLLFAGMLWLSGRRNRQGPVRRQEFDAEGPMTRIVGKRTQAHRATEPMAPAPGMAAPTIAGAVGGTLMTGPLSDVRSQGDDIQVTEMGDEEAIRELYADFVNKQDVASGRPRQAAAARRARSADETTHFEQGTRFGDDVPATRMTVPLTTQLAVDIDLTPDATTQGLAPTQTATRTLELNLELDLPSKPTAPPTDRKDG
ncbi:MAG: hypothetical protein U5L03_06560 [Burkholderiaceae bacterium]|nr:hypothetical protein [Burkholderiaceae bacterium]